MKKHIRQNKAALIAVGFLFTAIPTPGFAAPADTAVTFNIKAQDLGSALNELARQSDREIYFSAELTRNKQGEELNGAMSVEQALEILLSGTGLRYRIDGNNSIVILTDDASPLNQLGESDESSIIVTGTLIRGVAPQASATTSLSREDIEAKAPSGADQLLRSIPQITSFNSVSAVGSNVDGGSGQNSISTNFTNQTQKPSLRNISSGGPTTTLVLIDGRRVAGAGLFNPSPDPDIVSPAILERVEVVLDGGSAIYGSDAVAGVINFITRREFNGLEVDARAGAADDFYSFNSNITYGNSWNTGSSYISYSYAKKDEILGKSRDYIQSLDWSNDIPVGRQCANGNVTVGARTYGLPGLNLNDPNVCDPTDYQTIIPEEDRHNVFAGFAQDIGENIKFDVKGFYSTRDTEANSGPLLTTVTVTPSNPFYQNLPGADAGATQSVLFNYAPVNGNDAGVNSTKLRQWGITPSITVDLWSDWQMRAFANWSESRTTYRNQALNEALQTTYVNGTTTGNALNPYDIAATPNQQLISDVLDWQRYGFARSRLQNYRMVLDGSLFPLPGGPVRLAIGAEYINESFKIRSGFTERNAEDSLASNSYSRDDMALFGEVNVPLIGSQNDIPFIHSLDVSASLRRDEYSDFGSTTNPKVGASFSPVDWLKLRVSWGRSFNAPSPSDQLASLANNLSILPYPLVSPPDGSSPPPLGSFTIVRFGALPDLEAQRATSFSYGLDIAPLWIPGLTATANIYQVEFTGQLGNPPFFNSTELFAHYQDQVQLFPSMAQIEEAGSSVAGGDAQVAPFLGPFGPQVYAIIDARTRNLGRTKIRGLDFNVAYNLGTNFGSLDFGAAGNYQLKRQFAPSPTAPFDDIDLDYVNRLRLTANAGITAGSFRAQATLNHSQGYKIARSSTVYQDRVDSFNVVNLFFKYDISTPQVANKLSLTLNIDNVLDQDPPILRSTGSTGITNGSTLGRLFQLGFNAKF